MISGYHLEVAHHYERFPYPTYPWYSTASWKQLEAVDARLWGATRDVRDIWIAGCGTIAPVMFARRNFFARLWGTDLSESALKIARQRLSLLGLQNIYLKQEDLFEARYLDAFDAIDCYGVIHHTISPQKALESLTRALRPGGVLRLMVYSQDSRADIEVLRRRIREQDIHSIEGVENFLVSESVQRSGDLRTRNGVADALLNPISHLFSEASLRDLISKVGCLRIVKLLSARNLVVFCLKV